MDYYILSTPFNRADHLFFAASFKHCSAFYKVAVSEQFSPQHARYADAYSILLQSETRTDTYKLYKSKEQWLCDDPRLQHEIVFLIGSQIDTIKE